MIKIYGMETCPDCTYVEEQVKDNNQYEVIDIGQHVRDLKAFLRLRDHHPALRSRWNSLLCIGRRYGYFESRRCRITFTSYQRRSNM